MESEKEENTIDEDDSTQPPQYKCPLALMMLSNCTQTFQTLRQQKAHIKYYHSTIGEKGSNRIKSTLIHYCEECIGNKTFKTPKELRIHKQRIHPYKGQLTYTCNETGCEKLIYTTKESLQLHTYRNHREPIFQCSYCSEPPFSVRGDLSHHIRRKHKIDQCEMKFHL